MEKDLPDYLKDISGTNNMIHNDMIQPFYGGYNNSGMPMGIPEILHIDIIHH